MFKEKYTWANTYYYSVSFMKRKTQKGIVSFFLLSPCLFLIINLITTKALIRIKTLQLAPFKANKQWRLPIFSLHLLPLKKICA